MVVVGCVCSSVSQGVGCVAVVVGGVVVGGIVLPRLVAGLVVVVGWRLALEAVVGLGRGACSWGW